MKRKNIPCVVMLLAVLLLSASGHAQSAQGRGRAAKPVQQKKSAQKNVKATKQKGRNVSEESDPLTPDLLRATQRLLVFDSLVVDGGRWVQQLPLGSDQGRITTYDSFFGSTGHKDAMLYVNGLGNMCIFSRTDKDSVSRLYSSDLLAGKWSNAAPLRGLAEKGRFTQMNYPFMMSDGVTLYFAAKGEETLGGWDLFRSTYSASTGSYLKAESMGLPFCSTDDDLLLAYNETDSVGILVSKRGQQGGRVCLYFFLPTSSHQTYEQLDPESDELRQLAALSRIRLTWKGRGAEQKRAASRLQRLRQTQASDSGDGVQTGISFFVRDGLTYTSVRQFRSEGGAKRYLQLAADRQQLVRLKAQTARQREQYVAKPGEQLAAAILKSEQTVEQLERQIAQQEKELRNAENRAGELRVKN